MNSQELRERTKGVDIVLITPLKENGELDLEGLKTNVRFLLGQTRDKDFMLTPVGSTGEFYALSESEHKAVIRTVVETVGGQIPVFAGAAQAATPQTIAMSRYAQEVGADGVQIVLPYYHIPTEEGMYQHYAAIAEAVDIGIKIYNNPAVSGCWIRPHLMARLAEIENIVALKENTPHIMHYYQMRRALDLDKITLLCGLGEMMYSFEVVHGCMGFVTWVANFAPQLSYEVYQAGESRDMDRLTQAVRRIAPLWEFLGQVTAAHTHTGVLPEPYEGATMYVSVTKAAMDMVGLQGGPPRLPMVALTDAEKGRFQEILGAMGLL